ncbi:hypothetical protein IMSAGC013_04333 [Lachnospiraceae bacterium]|nr:hypothetical protein IMSAGC013_04333 [Lachnospiraceae bacterium]
MNRNRKGKMPEITREMYKSIKKYDRQQFTAFCTDLYGFGFQDGRESVPGVDITAIMKAIENTKGIGAKKLADIRTSIEAVFTKDGDNE